MIAGIKQECAGCMIAMAPQNPYFSAWAGDGHGYLRNVSLFDDVDLILIQFYNQNDSSITYDKIVNTVDGPLRALVDAGIPREKIIVGKPLMKADIPSGAALKSNNGWMPLKD